MNSDVIVFECDLTDNSKDVDDDFIIEDLTRLISKTKEYTEFYYFSRRVNKVKDKSQIWLVTKANSGSSAQLQKAGNSFLKSCEKAQRISNYRIRTETESGALDCVEGIPDHVDYGFFWRFAQAGSDAALEILKKKSPAGGYVCIAGRGTDIKSGIAYHWAHFFWNALGIQEYRV